MKVKSHIAILLGSLILINLGHNIIPHHHHLDDVYSHDGCDQHDPPEHTGETDDPSGHCHAFNGFEYVLSFEKIFKQDHLKSISKVFTAPIFQYEEPEKKSFYTCRSVGPPPCSPGNLGISPGLRAPPLA
ncbi:hypothetical protein ACFLTA_03155 [Bacteroidota bacterium]